LNIPFQRHKRIKVFISLVPKDGLPKGEETLDEPLEGTGVLYYTKTLTKAGWLSLKK
jgi:hypothetical protein